METILENGESLDVTSAKRDTLEQLGLIYHCDDPECRLYHIDNDHTWADIEQELSR